MIVNITYNNPEVKAQIDQLVGRSHGWVQRFKMGGIGSRRMLINDASPRILHWLEMQNSARYCYLELRPGGIIVHFRSILETFGWVIPHYHLSIFKNGKEFSLHGSGEFMKIGGINNFDPDYAFFKKLMDQQVDWSDTQPLR